MIRLRPRSCPPIPSLYRFYSKSKQDQLDFAQRKQQIKVTKDVVYPLLGEIPVNKAAELMRIPDLISKWSNSATHTSKIPDTPLICIQGRIRSIRLAGKNLVFLDVVQESRKVQVVLNRNKLNNSMDETDFQTKQSFFRRGDIIRVNGYPWRTNRGEFSILASEMLTILAPCLHPLPVSELKEVNKMRNRVIDLAAFEDSRQVISARSTIISSVRNFFANRDFMEVQTPILSALAGGANARPFTTKGNALSDGQEETNLSLRIAPELWLKRLIISGFDRVFEIGQCFRNEGVDSTHNPEFTTCEFYQSYASLEDLIEITEQLLITVAESVRTSYPKFETFSNEMIEIFKEKPEKLDFISTIETKCQGNLPEDLNDTKALYEFCIKHGITANSQDSSVKLLDNLASAFIEPSCERAGYIMNHPSIMAPLAKSSTVTINGIKRHVSRRFELVFKGKELVNAYEEENSPFIQETNFRQQMNDEETPLPDDSYVKAMEYGLPPTGGWGIGIDRLCMALTGSSRIGHVLPFGDIRAVKNSET